MVGRIVEVIRWAIVDLACILLNVKPVPWCDGDLCRSRSKDDV